MRMRLAVILVAATILQVAPAGAHGLRATITPPATAAVENSAFVIQVGGDVTMLPGRPGPDGVCVRTPGA
jgi:hypothetical protein